MTNPLIAALEPLTRRVRTDMTWTRNAAGEQRCRHHQELTPERLAAHLNGGPARGVCPIRAGEATTLVATLDLDSHKGETPWPEMACRAYTLCDVLSLAWGASPVAFRSTGGRGVHIHILFAQPQDAYSVRQWLRGVLESVGLRVGNGGVARGEAEIFPKQDHVAADGYGNQFILPLAGASCWLVPDDLVGWLAPAEAPLTAADWLDSPAVPVVEKPAPVLYDGQASSWALDAPWRAALTALLGKPDHFNDREPWRDVLFALHHESEGSEDGRALAHEWSAALPQYEAAEVDKLWDGATVRPDGKTGRTIMALARQVAGWHEPIDASGFGPVDEDGRDLGELAEVAKPYDDGAAGGAGGDGADGAQAHETRRGVPKAQHLCTDQANANRLVREYGAKLMVAAGSWYVWDGRRWARDEGEVYRYACQLGLVVKTEAKATRARAAAKGADVAAMRVAEAIASALDKWSTKSEMKGAIEAALGLARKMLTVEPESLDRSPWLLNVLNGTVDLRTGVLRPHRLEDRITKLVGVRYRPGARSLAWERMLHDVCCGDMALVAFLRRWLGYCCTGSTREQKFAVLWGGGGNGKSVLVAAVEEVLGEYAATAATELVVAKGSGMGGSGVHSASIAALVGRRLVTAHESGETGALAEAFIKKATGSDKMDARYLYGEQFSFTPTHKIQLLTNYKPTIKGQDKGIWRRVILIPFVARFGSEAEVASGVATHVRDVMMLSLLGREEDREGILADLVQGAVEWFVGGLREPDCVLAAGEEYRGEQDRIGQFVNECCELSVTFSEPLTGAVGGGLYPAYQDWCRAGGVLPVSKQRFTKDLERVVPYVKMEPGKSSVAEGRRKILRVYGIRLLPED